MSPIDRVSAPHTKATGSWVYVRSDYRWPSQLRRRLEYVKALASSDLSLDAAQIVISEVAFELRDRTPPDIGCVYQWLHYWRKYGVPCPELRVQERANLRSAASGGGL